MTGIAGQAKNDNANACDDDDNSYEIDKCKWLQLDAVLNHLKFDNQKNMLKEANKKIGGR
ncbi:MAG: hypothetical protein LBV16_05045 [Elusimicrobiota bacterium]|jgi:hypothetical protein|nr:hypothetical protein [Elusimicrobiota bacterium]